MTMPRKLPLPDGFADVIEAVKALAADHGTVGLAAVKGSSSLIDFNKNWEPGMHQNRLVRIIKGAGVGQSRVVSDNTETTLALQTPWATALDTTSVYVVLNQGVEALIVDIALLLARMGWEGGISLADKLTAARVALIDQITALRMAELDAANLPADLDTLKAAVGDPSADALPSLRDKLGDLQRDLYLMLDEIGRWDTAGSLSTDIVTLLNDVAITLASVGLANGSTLGSLYAILGNPATALAARIGNPDAHTLNSLVAKLGDPAQDYNAMVGYEGATSLANKVTLVRAGNLDRIPGIESRVNAGFLLIPFFYTTATVKDGDATLFSISAVGGSKKNIRFGFYLSADPAATFTVSVWKTRVGDLTTFTQDDTKTSAGLPWTIATPGAPGQYTYEAGDLEQGLQMEIRIHQSNAGNATNLCVATLTLEG